MWRNNWVLDSNEEDVRKEGWRWGEGGHHVISMNENSLSHGHPITTEWTGYKAAWILPPKYFLRKLLQGNMVQDQISLFLIPFFSAPTPLHPQISPVNLSIALLLSLHQPLVLSYSPTQKPDIVEVQLFKKSVRIWNQNNGYVWRWGKGMGQRRGTEWH